MQIKISKSHILLLSQHQLKQLCSLTRHGHSMGQRAYSLSDMQVWTASLSTQQILNINEELSNFQTYDLIAVFKILSERHNKRFIQKLHTDVFVALLFIREKSLEMT